MERLAIPLKALDAELTVPACAYAGDAAVDLRSTVDETLQPFERKLVPCGIAVAIPAGYAGFEIKRGDRIAQLAIMRVAEAVFEPCEDLPATDRGTGGFGSSGIGA